MQAYSFDIIHRKGLLHSNVDALSRPVDVSEVLLALQTKTETVPLETTDPFKNDELMHFIIHRKHHPGVGTKQCKRIATVSPLYTAANDKIWYTAERSNSTGSLEVPPLTLRTEIIERAHLLGHFQAETTYNRLKSIYYWPTMEDDIKHVISKCIPCKRNQSAPVQSHSALALPITGVFERVGMDLVFGLPETTDGYKGIMVLTEYLTKYPYAVPIRSKCADEIATHLFGFISFFGPPKILLSDQGKEFLNTIVDHLSKISGIERRVTSPYHPQTNGMTERFNHTR